LIGAKDMPVFYVRKQYFKALENGEKTAEIRIGKYWLNTARRIMNGELKPIAIFRSGRKTLIREIERIEIYPTLKSALRNKRWKKLGLGAPTYKSAVNEISKLYQGYNKKPVVIFWLKNPKER